MPKSPSIIAHVSRSSARFAGALLAAVLATVHVQIAHGQAITRITGTANAIFPFGGGLDASFSCETAPGSLDPCVGTYHSTVWFPSCSNKFQLAGPVTVTGLVAQPGPIRGTITYAENDFRSRIEADGTCTFIPGSFATIVDRYSGTWDGTRGFITMSERPGAGWHMTSSFFVDRNVPVFPLAVSGKIDGRQANATATIQYRTQDVGTAGGVYVFALAPASRVQGANNPGVLKVGYAKVVGKTNHETPIACVLAQLTAAGQMVAVSSSNLAAYLTGVLSAQGASVTILNGVPTGNVSGATFFVGYGPSAGATINGGTNRAVVTVSGQVECRPSAPETGWWWNPLEDGRGFSIEKRGNNLFFASFLYHESGRSQWFVSSGPVSLEGSLYNGNLLSASAGQTLGGPYIRFPALRDEGVMTLTFNTASNGTLVWRGGTVPIQRFNIIPNGLTLPAVPGQPESGWWWNEQESGRGFFLEFQSGWLDIAGYMYDQDGNPVWYLTVGQIGGTGEQRTFSGSWWSYGNGMTIGGPWRPHTRINSNVAPVTITFTGADTAIMTLPNSRTTNLRRHRF